MKPESREYLLMIIGGTLTMFAGGLVQPVFAPFVRQEFTAPIFLVGLAVSGYFVVRMLAEFPIGVLSDKVAMRKLLIVGRFFGIFGALACYLTSDIWVLIVARALWGCGRRELLLHRHDIREQPLPEQDDVAGTLASSRRWS